MNYKDGFNRYRSSLLIVAIIMGTGIALIFQNSMIIEAGATTLTQDNSNTTSTSATVATTSTLNNTFYHDSDREINTLTSAFGLPFYELTDSKDTGKEVVSIDPEQPRTLT